MRRRKKEPGCLASLAYAVLSIMLLGILISAFACGAVVIVIAILFVCLYKFCTFLVKKIHLHIKNKHVESEMSQKLKSEKEIMKSISYATVIEPQISRMSDYQIERFARECNAYTDKEYRKTQYENSQSQEKDCQPILADTEELIQKTRQNENYDNMEGHEFERFCAELLLKNGFESAEVTQGSGDHGIDILAEKDGITYAIQCKCYSSNIGNAAVQQAHTGKSIYRKDIAIVLTNRYFTPQAKEEAQALGVKLWDRDKLNDMIKKSNI